jgi:3-oxoacyl-[acyl-carrier protein] reductase
MSPGTAVITGGTRGIGLAAAEELAAAGYRVAVAGRTDAAAVDAAVARLRRHGVEASGALVDVRDMRAVAAWVHQVESSLGPITVAIAAAGNLHIKPFLELDEAAFDETIDTHVKGTFALLQSTARLMVKRARPGSLITLTSYGGIKASPAGLLDYAAAKGAIVAMTRTLAKELLPHAIRVNCVLPAAETRMTEALRASWGITAEMMGRGVLGGRYAQPETVAPIFAFLAGTDSRWVTGQTIAVDGGFGL